MSDSEMILINAKNDEKVTNENNIVDNHPQNKPTKNNIYKMLLALAIPIAFQNFLSALLNIIDNLMVSSLNSEIAEAAMSAVLLVNQYIFVFQIVIFSIAGAAAIFISQYYGRNKNEEIPNFFGFALLLTLIIGTITSVISAIIPTQLINLFFKPQDAMVLEFAGQFLGIVSYSFLPFALTTAITVAARGVKKVNLALVASIIAIAINSFLNYTMMFGKLGMPELGLKGAAYGTLISRILEFAIIFSYSIMKKYLIWSKIKVMFSFSKAFIRRFFKLFIPTCTNEVFWVLATSVYLLIFSQMSNSKSIGAALNITQSIDKIVFVVMLGIGNATGVIIGNTVGNSQNQTAIDYSKKCINFSMFAGLIVGAITFGLSFLIQYLFKNVTPETIIHARQLMWVYSAFMIVRSRNFTYAVGIIRNGGDVVFAMIVETITIWFIGVPLAYLGAITFALPIAITQLLIYIEEFAKTIVFEMRFRSKKWIKNLIN